MAYTTDQLAKLEAAIASGVETVRYGDKTVTYQSLNDMRRLRDEMRAELGFPAAGQQPGQSSRTTYASFVRD